MDELIRIGEIMSNTLFNWSQQERFTPDERRMMKELYSQWDVAQIRFSSRKPPANQHTNEDTDWNGEGIA